MEGKRMLGRAGLEVHVGCAAGMAFLTSPNDYYRQKLIWLTLKVGS